jgi:hypothetical protein
VQGLPAEAVAETHADEVSSASAHSTTDSGRCSHSQSPSSRVGAALGCWAPGGGRAARSNSVSPQVR